LHILQLGFGKVEWEVKQENQALLLTSLLYLGQLSQLVVDLVDEGGGVKSGQSR